MNAHALRKDLHRACQLIAARHGVSFKLNADTLSNDVAKLDLMFGEALDDPDYREYLAHHTSEMMAGHHTMKYRYPGLHDKMLGRRFTAYGKQFIYVGCKTSRPKYPVEILLIQGGSYSLRKATIGFLEDAIRQFAPELEKMKDETRKGVLNRVDPELAEGVVF